MKNWLTIGQFSKEVGVTAKALRLYEELGLIKSHTRGENNYRYYETGQIEVARRLKEFKDLGFSLNEIKSLLEADQGLNSEKLLAAMKVRLKVISQQAQVLKSQKVQIETILSSLQKKTEPLKAEQRRAIMSFYGKVSILVTGCEGLEKTAQYISEHYRNAGQEVPIISWSSNATLPDEKPYVVVVPERDLKHKEVEKINADIIVIRNLSVHAKDLESQYLRLFTKVGPHVTTVFNADDRSSVALADNAQVKKGRIFYYSKNRGLEDQIKKIGGVVSDGEDLDIYGLNSKAKNNFQLKKIMAFDDEIALLSSLAAVMDVGLDDKHFSGIDSK